VKHGRQQEASTGKRLHEVRTRGYTRCTNRLLDMEKARIIAGMHTRGHTIGSTLGGCDGHDGSLFRSFVRLGAAAVSVSLRAGIETLLSLLSWACACPAFLHFVTLDCLLISIVSKHQREQGGGHWKAVVDGGRSVFSAPLILCDRLALGDWHNV